MQPQQFLRDVKEGDCVQCKKALEFVETYSDDQGNWDGLFRCVNKRCKAYGKNTLEYLEGEEYGL